jgi:hypothetical protein
MRINAYFNKGYLPLVNNTNKFNSAMYRGTKFLGKTIVVWPCIVVVEKAVVVVVTCGVPEEVVLVDVPSSEVVFII